MTSRRFAALGIALFLAGGCEDGSGPSSLDRTYTLAAVNGAAPPGLVQSTVNCDVLISAGTIELTPDRNFVLIAEETFDCTASGGGVQLGTFSVGGTYDARGSRITFTVNNAATLDGRISDSELTATLPASQVTFPQDVALRFTRVP